MKDFINVRALISAEQSKKLNIYAAVSGINKSEALVKVIEAGLEAVEKEAN